MVFTRSHNRSMGGKSTRFGANSLADRVVFTEDGWKAILLLLVAIALLIASVWIALPWLFG